MENVVCEVTGCNREAEEYCKCEAILCGSHTHKAVAGHSSSPLRMIIHSSLKADIRRKVVEALDKCRHKQIELQKQSQRAIASILQETSISVQRIKFIEMELLQILNSIGTIDVLVLKGSSNLKEKPLADYMLTGGRLSMVSELELVNSSVLYSLIDPEIMESIDYSPLQTPSPYIACFKKGSKDMQVLNVTNMKIKINSTKALMGTRAGWCLLPDGRIFHYGGWVGDTKNTGICAIINPAQQSVEIIKSHKELRNLGQCSYYKGDVYVFGGHDQVTMLESFKYNILTNEWKAIASMPSKSRDCNSTVLGNTIVIGGMKHDSLLLYWPNSDIYKKTLQLSQEKYKIVWSGDGKVFVLWNDKIIESKTFDLNEWQCVASNIGINDNRLMGHSVRWGNWVFLLFEDKNLYKFNLQTKAIEAVFIGLKIDN